jgi:hypothetical protein
MEVEETGALLIDKRYPVVGMTVPEICQGLHIRALVRPSPTADGNSQRIGAKEGGGGARKENQAATGPIVVMIDEPYHGFGIRRQVGLEGLEHLAQIQLMDIRRTTRWIGVEVYAEHLATRAVVD